MAGCASGSLLLNSAGWLGARDHLLHGGEGPVARVRWCGALIAWANSAGVKLYDSSAHSRIAFIARPAGSPPPGAHSPHLVWHTDACLLIAWADSVQVASIAVRSIVADEAVDALERGMARGMGPVAVRSATVVAAFQTDAWLGGIAPLGEEAFLLLLWAKGRPPEVRCVARSDGAELTADALSLRGATSSSLLHLAWAPPTLPPAPLWSGGGEEGGGGDAPSFWAPGGGPSFVIASPSDVVVATPRDLPAHCAWLSGRGRHAAALAAAEAGEAACAPASRAAGLAAGAAWIDALLASHRGGEAAALCPRVLRGDVAAWEATLFTFSHANALPSLAPVLPLTLPPGCYEMCVAAAASSNDAADIGAISAVARTWPPHLLHPRVVATALQARIASDAAAAAVRREAALVGGAGGTPPHAPQHAPDGASSSTHAALVDAMAAVLVADGDVAAAAVALLDAASPKALALLSSHRLAAVISPRIPRLAALDHGGAAALLVEERGSVPPAAVVSALLRHRAGGGNASSSSSSSPMPDGDAPPSPELCERLCVAYLRALFRADADSARPHAPTLLSLVATHSPGELYGLLTSGMEYPLESGLAAAVAANSVACRVHVLTRMGDSRGALALLLDSSGDIDAAVAFVSEQNDAALWGELVARAAAAPALAGALLEHIGGAADARPLLVALPAGMRMERLRERLGGLLTDARREAGMWTDCAACLHADLVAGSRTLYAGGARAMAPASVRLG